MANLSKHIATEIGSANAWFKYDQTGTPSVGDEFNITSITDNAVGESTVTIANDMASDDYTICGLPFEDNGSVTTGRNTVGFDGASSTKQTGGAFQQEMTDDNSNAVDYPYVTQTVHGKLA